MDISLENPQSHIDYIIRHRRHIYHMLSHKVSNVFQIHMHLNFFSRIFSCPNSNSRTCQFCFTFINFSSFDKDHQKNLFNHNELLLHLYQRLLHHRFKRVMMNSSQCQLTTNSFRS